MTPEEAVVYYDDPAHAAFMCDVLMRARPGWVVWRDADRMWKAKRESDPAARPPLAYAIAGLLNRAMYEAAGGGTA